MPNLYAFDLVSHTQNMLSVNADGTAPASGAVEPFSFFVDPAGGSVVFLSAATDMVAGVSDTPFTYDLFLADLPAPTSPSQCGDPVPDTNVTLGLSAGGSNLVKASDALVVLRTAVGSATCETCVCDVDGSGTVSATDALVTLKIAVGQSIALACPPC